MPLRRVGLVLVVAAAGCIFTPRPMIPLDPDAGGGLANMGDDVGRTGYGDSGAAIPGADAGAASFDAPASDAPPGTADSDCRPRGDAGFFDDAGNPCDPTAGAGDGGAHEAPDASCDADVASDGATADRPATDGAATDGAAAACDGVAGAIARGPR